MIVAVVAIFTFRSSNSVIDREGKESLLALVISFVDFLTLFAGGVFFHQFLLKKA